MFKMRKHLY